MAPPPPFRNPAGIHPFILNLGSFDQGTVPNTMPNIKASIVAAVFKLDPTFRLRCTTWWFMGQVFDGQNPQSSPVDMEKCSIIYRGFISCIHSRWWRRMKWMKSCKNHMLILHVNEMQTSINQSKHHKTPAIHVENPTPCIYVLNAHALDKFMKTASLPSWCVEPFFLGVDWSFSTIPTVSRCSRCSRILHGVLTLGIAHPLIWNLKMQLRNHTTTQW